MGNSPPVAWTACLRLEWQPQPPANLSEQRLGSHQTEQEPGGMHSQPLAHYENTVQDAVGHVFCVLTALIGIGCTPTTVSLDHGCQEWNIRCIRQHSKRRHANRQTDRHADKHYKVHTSSECMRASQGQATAMAALCSRICLRRGISCRTRCCSNLQQHEVVGFAG